MRTISFAPVAFAEYNDWADTDSAIHDKIKDLIKEILREPFKGKGKPEPLKGDYKGYWSRRINEEHRLIYKVDNESVYIAKCKGHY